MKIYYGMTRYVLHICCLDNHISCTGQMRAWTSPMPYAHNVSLKKEVPEIWKNWLEFSNVAATPFEVVCVLMPWKGLRQKITKCWLAWWVPIWHCWRALVSNHISHFRRRVVFPSKINIVFTDYFIMVARLLHCGFPWLVLQFEYD